MAKAGADCENKNSVKELGRQAREKHCDTETELVIRKVVFIFILFIYLFACFLAALGFRCCARASSSCGERGLLFVAVRGLLIAVAYLVVERGL